MRDGSGSYSNPYPNFVNGTVISSDEADANNADIATALTQSIAVDGQTTITANLPMNSKKFTGLAAGTAATDSLTLGQAQAQAFAWGGTAGGSADAITIAPTPAITAYAVGQKFFWIASGSANTGAATIAISGLTAIAMQDGGAALAAGVHAAGKVYMGVLNTTSTCQIMQVQSSGDPLVISGLTVNGTADITGTTTVVALTASGLVTAGANVDMNGTELILDADADTSITADTDDQIDFKIGGTDKLTLTAAKASLLDVIASLTPTAGDVLSFPTPTTAAGRSIPGKNLLHNGAMTVSQRGVNATILSGFDSTTSSYIADRFLASGAGTPQNRADLKHVSTGGPTGFPNFIRYDVTTAEAAVGATEYTAIQQRIEGNNLKHLKFGTADAVSLTLSFWMRSPKTGTHCVALSENSGGKTQNQEFTVAVADTWEQHTATFTPETAGGISETTTEGMRLIFPIICGSSYQGAAGTWVGSFFAATSNQQNLADNTANNIDITGVQLEVGSVATDFEHEDIGETERKCFRYQRMFAIAASDQLAGSAIQSSSTAGIALVPLSPPLRATPATVTVSAASHFTVSEYGAGGRLLSALTLEAGATKDMLSLNYTNAASGLAPNESNLVTSNNAAATVLVEANL